MVIIDYYFEQFKVTNEYLKNLQFQEHKTEEIEIYD